MSEINFKKKFGQNFLTDKNLLDAIVRDAGVTAEDEVLEIGAGAGALTTAISRQAKKVVSFEIDRELEPELKSLALENAEFVFADALKTDMEQIEKHFAGKYKLVANLPYYITSPLIFKFLEGSSRITSLTIMVQKEVAERICAKCGGKDYGLMSVMVNFYGDAKITRGVGRKMFTPVPNVDSAVVRIDIDNKFPDIDKKEFSNFIKACFAMRRKTLLNNLGSAGYDKTILLEKLGEETLKRRAESLRLEDFVQLFRKIN